MARDGIAFHANDLSAFARALRKGLTEAAALIRALAGRGV